MASRVAPGARRPTRRSLQEAFAAPRTVPPAARRRYWPATRRPAARIPGRPWPSACCSTSASSSAAHDVVALRACSPGRSDAERATLERAPRPRRSPPHPTPVLKARSTTRRREEPRPSSHAGDLLKAQVRNASRSSPPSRHRPLRRRYSGQTAATTSSPPSNRPGAAAGRPHRRVTGRTANCPQLVGRFAASGRHPHEHYLGDKPGFVASLQLM